MNSTDADFKRSVERDARRAGMSPELASSLAKYVGAKQPRASVIDPTRHRASATGAQRAPRAVATRAQAAPRVPSTREGRIDALCRMYGAAALANDFKDHRGVPLRAFAAMLNAAVGTRAKITPAGIDHCRLALMAAKRGAA